MTQQVEYTYIKLEAKAPRPNRPTVGEKPSAFHAYEGSKRVFHIVREGDTVTVTSADAGASYRVVEIPWAKVEYAERSVPKVREQPHPVQQKAGGR